VFFDLFCLQFSFNQNLVSDYTCFLICFFFANFDHTTIVNLVSDFTCFFFIIFLNGHGLSILLSRGSFVPKFWKMIKIVLMHFGVKNSNSTKWTYVVYDLDGSIRGLRSLRIVWTIGHQILP